MSCFCKNIKPVRFRSLKDKIRYRIKRSKKNIFLVQDFADLSGRDQILRALRLLIKEELILRVGKGVYVKARRSTISQGIVPVQNLHSIAIELMRTLDITVLPTQAELAYNTKQSTQVPNTLMIGVNKRVTRKLKFQNMQISYVKTK